jgi:hypothetical protein
LARCAETNILAEEFEEADEAKETEEGEEVREHGNTDTECGPQSSLRKDADRRERKF